MLQLGARTFCVPTFQYMNQPLHGLKGSALFSIFYKHAQPIWLLPGNSRHFGMNGHICKCFFKRHVKISNFHVENFRCRTTKSKLDILFRGIVVYKNFILNSSPDFPEGLTRGCIFEANQKPLPILKIFLSTNSSQRRTCSLYIFHISLRKPISIVLIIKLLQKTRQRTRLTNDNGYFNKIRLLIFFDISVTQINQELSFKRLPVMCSRKYYETESIHIHISISFFKSMCTHNLNSMESKSHSLFENIISPDNIDRCNISMAHKKINLNEGSRLGTKRTTIASFISMCHEKMSNVII